ncbi:salt stress protein, Slr1339 family [Leptolyngbya sp. AN03gr2]|uniref:salt stress protein, Slr1339 family n=1 Tax=unclassified Leptolyngbya TaxID=2650499 RepID=UPI003D32124F
MDEIDKLLNSLNNNASELRPSSEAKPAAARSSIEDLLKQIDGEPQVTPSPSSDRLFDGEPQVTPSPSSDRLFDDLKQEREESLKQAAQQKQERLEQLKQQRRQALTVKAQEWLKNLDPNSSEGRWFEEFACNYENRIVAAIDYLEALQEVDRE